MAHVRPHMDDKLTLDECLILQTVGVEGSYAEASQSLDMSIATLKNKIYAIHRKMGTSSTSKCLWDHFILNRNARQYCHLTVADTLGTVYSNIRSEAP